MEPESQQLAARSTAARLPHTGLAAKLTKRVQALIAWGAGNHNSKQAGEKPPATSLFPGIDPVVDGDDCDHDCATCTVSYPRGFKIDESASLYGAIKAWQTHLVVATAKSDWVRDISEEKGSVMASIKRVEGMKLSASNMPLPTSSTGYNDPTSILLLPAMMIVDNVTPANVNVFLRTFVEQSVTSTTPLGGAIDSGQNAPWLSEGARCAKGPQQVETPLLSEPSFTPFIPITPNGPELRGRACPHGAVIFLCSHRTRDSRCGQSAPLLRRELERHLRPLGLYRDLDDERPGGVGIYFISHVGGHKWSANMLIYRGVDPWGVDKMSWDADVEAVTESVRRRAARGENSRTTDQRGAAQCIWLARVRPEDCWGIVKYTVLQGKVAKPGSQLRGGFNRERGLVSW